MANAKLERVVIVGKTHMGIGVCVGAIVESTGRAIRLLPVKKNYHRFDTEFQVGELWEMSLRPRTPADPPHTEDHDEWGARKVGAIPDMVAFINRVARPLVGEPTGLFGGMLRFRPAGSAYLPRVTPLPAWSVGFWVAPRPLTYSAFGDKHRYHMAGKPGLKLTYVGHEGPVYTIPAGAMLRVSLARWWSNPNDPGEGEACSLQLSGWFGVPADVPRVPVAAVKIGPVLDDGGR